MLIGEFRISAANIYDVARSPGGTTKREMI